MSNVQAIQQADFESKVQKSSLPVILDFGAEWCGPCKRLAPIVDDLAAEYTGKVVFYSIDADSSAELVGRFQVMSLPTIVVIKGGREVARTVGLQSKDKLADLIKPHL